jgi:hypothetical protein
MRRVSIDDRSSQRLFAPAPDREIHSVNPSGSAYVSDDRLALSLIVLAAESFAGVIAAPSFVDLLCLYRDWIMNT